MISSEGFKQSSEHKSLKMFLKVLSIVVALNFSSAQMPSVPEIPSMPSLPGASEFEGMMESIESAMEEGGDYNYNAESEAEDYYNFEGIFSENRAKNAAMN